MINAFMDNKKYPMSYQDAYIISAVIMTRAHEKCPQKFAENPERWIQGR
jgi:hypothetical protein